MSEDTLPFQIGQLVTFRPDRKPNDRMPYTTCLYERDDRWALYECIDLTRFPSWNDFHGHKILVERGTSGVILRCVGAPLGMLVDNPQADLDLRVYSVLIGGHTVQVFGCDLQP